MPGGCPACGGRGSACRPTHASRTRPAPADNTVPGPLINRYAALIEGHPLGCSVLADSITAVSSESSSRVAAARSVKHSVDQISQAAGCSERPRRGQTRLQFASNRAAQAKDADLLAVQAELHRPAQAAQHAPFRGRPSAGARLSGSEQRRLLHCRGAALPNGRYGKPLLIIQNQRRRSRLFFSATALLRAPRGGAGGSSREGSPPSPRWRASLMIYGRFSTWRRKGAG